MAKGEPHPNHDRVIAVRSWRQFEELIADPVYRGWAFRGQSNADLPLYRALCATSCTPACTVTPGPGKRNELGISSARPTSS